MPGSIARVVGSGYTTFEYAGQPILLCEAVEDSGQRAFSDVGQAYQFIHPLGNRYPLEIATSRVLQGGTLQLTIREAWASPVWHQLAGLAEAYTIVDIFEILARSVEYTTCTMRILPPAGSGARGRMKTFHKATVVDVTDGDTITVGALTVTKGVTIAYTHATYSPL